MVQVGTTNQKKEGKKMISIGIDIAKEKFHKKGTIYIKGWRIKTDRIHKIKEMENILFVFPQKMQEIWKDSMQKSVIIYF